MNNESKYVFIEEFNLALDVSNIYSISRDNKVVTIQPKQCMGTYQSEYEFDTQYRAKEVQMKINEMLQVKEI